MMISLQATLITYLQGRRQVIIVPVPMRLRHLFLPAHSNSACQSNTKHFHLLLNINNLKLHFCRRIVIPTQHSAAAVFGRGSAPAKLGAARSICTDAVSTTAVAACACWSWAGRAAATTTTAAVFGRGSAPAKLGAALSICTDAVSTTAVAACACWSWAGRTDGRRGRRRGRR